MAKKASARRKDEAADEGFANNKYADERIAATFDYNELCLARASELLAPRLRAGLTVATFAALLGVICGLGVYTLMGIFKLNLWGWHNIAWGCAAGFIASVVGMYLGPRPSRAVAEVFFPHKAA